MLCSRRLAQDITCITSNMPLSLVQQISVSVRSVSNPCMLCFASVTYIPKSTRVSPCDWHLAVHPPSFSLLYLFPQPPSLPPSLHSHHPRRWCRLPSVPAHDAEGKASGAHRRCIPPHRRPHEQLHQQRSLKDLHPHPVQLNLPQQALGQGVCVSTHPQLTQIYPCSCSLEL